MAQRLKTFHKTDKKTASFPHKDAAAAWNTRHQVVGLLSYYQQLPSGVCTTDGTPSQNSRASPCPCITMPHICRLLPEAPMHRNALSGDPPSLDSKQPCGCPIQLWSLKCQRISEPTSMSPLFTSRSGGHYDPLLVLHVSEWVSNSL